jgi:hypothetical protein
VKLTEVKALFAPGTRWAVTNHYISREDHPAYGTTERTVTRVTSGRTYMAYPNGAESPIDWPKATQVSVEDDGTVTFRSHPKMPDQPFLTFVPVAAVTA